MHGMRLLAALSIACAARAASAQRAISVDVQGVPFDARELTEALRVRLAPDGAPVHVRVTAGANGVHIEAHGEARDLDLRGLSGPAAARLVALATDDLTLDDLVAVPAPVPRPERTLALLGTAASWPGTLGIGSAELTIPVGSAFAAITAGGGELVTGRLALYSGTVRAEVGVRRGWLDVRAGAVAEPVVVTTGQGDTAVVAGAGASVRARIPVADGMHAIVAVGIDAFATRTEYVEAGMAVVATPWWAGWLGLGVEVAL
jgi:hypothetical protein